MNLFNTLPGFKREPAGLEWALLRRLPLLTFAGIAVPILCVVTLRLAALLSVGPAAKLVMSIEIVLASLVVLCWTTVLTVTIGCVIVMIAKGPAYVADAYPLPDADAPLP